MPSHDLDPGDPLTLPSTAVDAATLAGLLTHARDAIVIRRQTGKILYWNQGAERIDGWPAADALGSISHVLLQTRFPTPLATIDVVLRERGEWAGRLVHQRRDGVDRGSTFIVRLPRPGEAAPPASPGTEAAAQAGHTMPRRVLIADDNLDAAESLQLWLQMAGHDVHVAHDGRAAVAAAESLQPEVVVLDLGMPGLSGLEAARMIRQAPWGKTMVLIALTGWGQDEDRRQTGEAGFDHHLIKPVSPDEIEALISRA